MGDDIGWYNPSIYHRGDMGYRTPNIDRIGKEGAMFTCWYGQQSCTAGRAAFITGQSPIRTGLTKVGLPGADIGLSGRIRPSQRCSNRWVMPPGSSARITLGDKDEFLPTKHGFDEFFGNLYHLNAEEEPGECGLPEESGIQKEDSARAACSSALPTARSRTLAR